MNDLQDVHFDERNSAKGAWFMGGWCPMIQQRQWDRLENKNVIIIIIIIKDLHSAIYKAAQEQ